MRTVRIDTRAVVLPCVDIDEQAVIAVGSLVTVPARAVVAGNRRE